MIKIRHYKKDGVISGSYTDEIFNGSIGEYVVNNFYGQSIPFAVFSSLGISCALNLK